MAADQTGPRTGTVRQLCRKRPVAAFVIAAFALSWPVMIATRDLASPVPLVGVPPSIAAFLVVGLGHGRAGLRTLARRLLIFRVGLRWYGFALLALGTCSWVTAYAITAIFVPASLAQPLPDLLISAPINFLVIFVLAGLGEEFGWRGHALPLLQQRHGPLAAALIIGVIWFCWHLPLNVGREDWIAYQAAFVVGVIADSIIYAWVFNRTGGSVLLAALMHAAGNTWGGVLYRGTFSFEPPGYLLFDIVRCATYAVVAVIIVLATRGRLGRSPDLHRQNG